MGLLNKIVRKPETEDIEVEKNDFTQATFETKEIVSEPVRAKVEPRSHETREIDDLREDVTKMLIALRESMRLSQDTVGDIKKISRFLESAEANLLSLERLKPENARLKTKLETIQSEISKADMRVHEVETQAAAFKSQYHQSSDELDATRSRLIEIQELLRREQAKNNDAVSDIERLVSEKRGLQNTIDKLESERTSLKESMEETQDSRLSLNRKITELMKQSEHLSVQIDDERRTKDMAMSKLRTLKRDYTELKTRHVEALSQVELYRQEVTSAHNILAEFQNRSEDKIFALTAALDNHKTQKKISDDMVRYEDSEKAKMKSEANLAKRKARELEKLLKQNTQDLNENREALSKANIRNEQLNDKFLALMVEMDSLRRAHNSQARKLGEYSSIEGAVEQALDAEEKGKRGKSRPADQLSGETIRGNGMIANLKLVTDTSKAS